MSDPQTLATLERAAREALRRRRLGPAARKRLRRILRRELRNGANGDDPDLLDSAEDGAREG